MIPNQRFVKMRFALSTNWNNRRLNDGAAIADEAIALGFDALELGFHTMPEQIPGFKSRLDQIPIDSVHAYTPIPMGAPSGSPELYQILVKNEDVRAHARFLLKKTFECAAELGAKAVVFHTGYVDLVTFFRSYGETALTYQLKLSNFDKTNQAYQKFLSKSLKLRKKRGQKMLDMFRKEMDSLIPDLEKYKITLALENLPRIEGFPNLDEAEIIMKEYASSPIRLWLDTGHAHKRFSYGVSQSVVEVAERLGESICGMHLNDIKDFYDDHREPGWGNVDFAGLKNFAQRDVLRVFEPHHPVTFDELKVSLAKVREMWKAY